jgi:hypothetical protein
MAVGLKAGTLHVDHYLALLPRGEEDTSPERAAPPRAKPAATPPPPPSTQSGAAPGGAAPAASPAFVIPGPPIRATVSVGQLFFDRLYAENVNGNVGVTAQGVTVKPLTMKLADGAATATGWLRTDRPQIAYSVEAQGADLDAEKLLAIVAPRLEGRVAGRGETAVSFAGVGVDEESLNRNLRGKGSFRVRDGRLSEMPILNALASVTQVSQLSDVRFFQFDAAWEIAQGNVQISQANVVGSLQKIQAKGRVGFDSSVDLAFNLWVGGELAARLRDKRIVKYLVVGPDKYLSLPVPIGMSGTLSKPRPSLKLPVDAILDIGINQGLKALDEYLQRRNRDE